ncbi:MAG: hypothetical protein AVDCRST_MAG76-2162, partial [uncultured Acidimicrobiales bacterium]
ARAARAHAAARCARVAGRLPGAPDRHRRLPGRRPQRPAGLVGRSGRHRAGRRHRVPRPLHHPRLRGEGRRPGGPPARGAPRRRWVGL